MDIFSGVVLEKHKGFAIILTADGQFKKIIVKGSCEVGEEVSGKEFVSVSGLNRKYLGSIAVAAALLIAVLVPGLTGGQNSSNTNVASLEEPSQNVVAYVKVDINPSLQLGVDERLIVKEAIPLNEDGEKVLADAQLTNHNITAAMELVTESCYELGYISEDKENVVNLTLISDSTASAKLDKTKLEKDVQTKVKEVLVDKNIKGEVKDFKELTKASLEKAKTNNNQDDKVKNRAEPATSGTKKNLDTPQNSGQTKSEKTESKDKGNSGKIKNEDQVKDNSQNAEPGKENTNKGNNSDSKQDKKVKEKRESSNINSIDKSRSDTKGPAKAKTYEDKDNKGNGKNNNDSKKLKEKEKGKSGDNELGIRLPWYKIFELG